MEVNYTANVDVEYPDGYIHIDWVLVEKYPEAKWDMTNNMYESLIWDNTNTIPKPTLDELKEKQSEMTKDSLVVMTRKLLENADKYVLPDWSHKSEEEKQVWLDYHQALRDFSANIDDLEDPEHPNWPTRPDGKTVLEIMLVNPF